MLKSEQEKSNLVPFFFTYSVFLLMVINVGTKLLTLCRQSWMRGGNKPMTPPVESPEQHPGPRKATFLHRWASTDRQGIRGFLSPLLLSLVIITHTVLVRIGAVLLAGAATLLSDFICPLFVFPELSCGRGHQGTERRYPPSLRALPDVRHIHMRYSWCWMAAQSDSSKRARGLATSSLPWAALWHRKPSPCLKGLAVTRLCCSRALLWKPVCLCGGMTEPHYAIVAFCSVYCLYSPFVSMVAIWKN